MTCDGAVCKLKLAFRAALRRARVLRAQIFVELFAGKAGSRAVLLREGYGTLSFELDDGDEFDVCRPAVLQLISGWLRSDCIAGILLGAPCTTWSRPRRDPPGSNWCAVRTPAAILCLSGLSPNGVEKIQVGNRTAAASARIVHWCVALKIFVFFGNPRIPFFAGLRC